MRGASLKGGSSKSLHSSSASAIPIASASARYLQPIDRFVYEADEPQKPAAQPHSPVKNKNTEEETRLSAMELVKSGYSFSPPDESKGREFLKRHKWSLGLQDALINSCKKLPLRFIIVDDSGSMATVDGNRLVNNGPTNKKMIKCTRWSELTASLKFHAELADAMGAPTEFRFLNLNNFEPILVGSGENSLENLDHAKQMFEESPSGATPLCHQIREVVSLIEKLDPYLRSTQQKICVVIATDGESSDGDITETMKPLENLSVWVVIRLCTDEESIVQYWNNIDSQLEIDIDVLDDLSGEAKEVYDVNPWLIYSQQLHHLREFGNSVKELDLLDEAMLSSEQMRVVVNMLTVGEPNPRSMPHPDEDWQAFVDVVKKANKVMGLTCWDTISKTLKEPIDLDKLKVSYVYSNINHSSSCCLS